MTSTSSTRGGIDEAIPLYVDRACRDWSTIYASTKAASLALFVLLVTMGGLLSCSGNDITDPGKITFPDSNVSFRAHVQPYFNLSCNTYGCHDQARSSNLNIELTSWIGVMANNVTHAGDTTSQLILVMDGRAAHSGQFLATENQRRGIKRWVLEGARNN
jgi:hypothetical protein